MGNYVGANAATKSPDESRLVTRYDVATSTLLPAGNCNLTNASTTTTMNNEHLHLAIQSLDALISKVVAEKTIQYQQQQQLHQQPQLLTTMIKDPKEENGDLKTIAKSAPTKQMSIASAELVNAFATSLANVLAGQSGQLNSVVDNSSSQGLSTARRPSSTVSSSSSPPLYRCPMENHNSTSGAGFSPDSAATTSKVNYKNLFPRNSSFSSTSPKFVSADSVARVDVNSLLQENGLPSHSLQQTSTTAVENRRMSNALIESMIGTGTNSGSPLDTIRINLPEILDAQDEITLLRLLIKLLTGKVTKLSDEKRRLLASISHLSNINAEMSMLIERGIQK